MRLAVICYNFFVEVGMAVIMVQFVHSAASEEHQVRTEMHFIENNVSS